MCFSIDSKFQSYTPTVHLNSQPLKWLSEHCYLGVILSNSLRDDFDIKRQSRAIYACGNVLIRKFRQCSKSVKCSLFQAYCTSFYCVQLWCNYSASSYKKVNVAYHNVFRYLIGVKGRHSISNLLVQNSVSGFNQVVRNLVHGLRKRLLSCGNSLVANILGSVFDLYGSKLASHWNSITGFPQDRENQLKHLPVQKLP